MKASPYLVPPAVKPPKSTVPQTASDDHDAIFLRADRLEGDGQKWVQAEGKVELRSRRVTVLADWLHFDVPGDEVWAKGNVTVRRGIDWITGPEVKFKRSDSTGFFIEPAFHVGENNSRGDASLLTFLGEDKFDVKDARYTTCVADNNDWFLSSADVELDKARSVGTAHNATVYFKDVPILYSPYLTFPLSNERKSGFLPPIYGSSNQRGFEIALPYYLNLAPNYDATLLARPMSRRGLQMGAQGPLSVSGRFGRGRRGILAARPHHRHQPLGGGVEAQPEFRQRSGRLREHPGGIRRHLFCRPVRSPGADVADQSAARLRLELQQRAGFVACALAELPDPAGSERADHAALFPRTAGGFYGQTGRMAQPRLRRGRRVRPLPSARAVAERKSQRALSDGGLVAAGQRVVLHRANRPAHDQLRSRQRLAAVDVANAFEFQSRAADQHRRHRAGLRARYLVVRPVVHPDPGAAPVLRADSVSQPKHLSQLRHRDRRLQLLAPVHRESLSGQRPYRRREPADRRNRIPLPRSGDRGRENALRHRPAVLLQEPAGDVERAAAHDEYFRPAGFRRGASVRHLDGCRRAAISGRSEADAAPRSGRAVPAGPRTGGQHRLSIYPRVPQLQRPGLATQADRSRPARCRSSTTGRRSAAGTIRWSTARRWRACSGFEYNGDCWVFRIAAQRLQTNTQQVTTAVFVQLELNGLARLGTNPGDVLRRSVPGYSTANDPALRAIGGRATNYFPEF